MPRMNAANESKGTISTGPCRTLLSRIARVRRFREVGDLNAVVRSPAVRALPPPHVREIDVVRSCRDVVRGGLAGLAHCLSSLLMCVMRVRLSAGSRALSLN